MNFEQIPEEDHELQAIPVEKLEKEAEKYEFNQTVYYLTPEGYAYNDRGEMVTDARRRQILHEGKIINKAA
ncbi:MAG TPA: hypothetical protein PLF71_00155 [bacterium]|nr:MAG: hypothetical protein BWY14_00811 [Parcubacteria group bacterium ADurb.Bin192]HPN14519.1 hypothetical protein [bacterium]